MAGDELVDVVDEFDQVIQVVPRRVMRADRLRHRAVFIAILDGAGRLLVHRRSPHKDVWPSWCDIAVGGVVGAGVEVIGACVVDVGGSSSQQAQFETSGE